MEFGNVAEGERSGYQDDSSDTNGRKKRYHRHTTFQIQKLESMFRDCPHPDEKQRLQLSRELGLAPRQIKFWFQNRRTQMKAQNERADNCALRVENDRIRCENIAIREALKNVICPSCGGSPSAENSYFDENKLRMENARLREELDRISSIAAKYTGRQMSHFLPVQQAHVSSLDLSMGNFGGQQIAGPSLDLDLDLLSNNNSSSFPYQQMGGGFALSDMDKSLMTDIATNAMDELLRLLQTNEPFWLKSAINGKYVLDLDAYDSIFQRTINHSKNANVRVEASRDSAVVIMNCLSLVDVFMDSNKWEELFSTIVSAAKTIEIISTRLIGTHSGCMQLMYEELQVPSPLVPTREFYILRYCQEIKDGLWAIVNVSHDIQQLSSQSAHIRMLPSGCLIQSTPDGFSKVTWLEHVEMEERNPIHQLYVDHVQNGMAFGAERWLATLQRICERVACEMGSGTSATHQLGISNLVAPMAEGKKSMMRLAQRMVNTFCSGINTSSTHNRTVIPTNDPAVRITFHKSTNQWQPNGVVLCATTSFWVPVSPQVGFRFFKDERTRAQWDVLWGNDLQEVVHIANGSHPGNCISVLRAFSASQSNMLLLQESCVDSSGSLVVYCSIDLSAINIAMSGEETNCIPLLPSGIAISPDGHREQIGDRASTSGNDEGGSLITVAFQILMDNLPSAKLNMESVNTVNNLIGRTVRQIKAALNFASC